VLADNDDHDERDKGDEGLFDRGRGKGKAEYSCSFSIFVANWEWFSITKLVIS
jgi:hypothetical protein